MYGIAVILALILGSFLNSVSKERQRYYAEFRKPDRYGAKFPNPIPIELGEYDRKQVIELERNWQKAKITFVLVVGGAFAWAFVSNQIEEANASKAAAESKIQFELGFEKGWKEGCENLFDSTSQNLFYEGTRYSISTCLENFAALSSSEVEYESGTDPEDAYKKGKSRGFGGAIWRVFEDVPYLCDGSNCWDFDSFVSPPVYGAP